MQKDGIDLIPVRMLTQYAYCKRLAYMEWVQGEFAYNSDVAEGKYQHRNVDVASGRKKLAEEHGDDTIHARSVTLSDAKLGLIAKIDLLEVNGKNATPVEYKKGSAPDSQERIYTDHAVQVCAQGLLLRANGYECTKGILYYIKSKRRVEVHLDDKIVATTLQMLCDMKKMAVDGIMPLPLVDSPKCSRCSLVGICMPDETNMLSQNHTQPIKIEQIRRMYPARNDSRSVYVQEQGAYVALSGDCIEVKIRDGKPRKIRLIDMSELVVFGNVQVTTQAIRRMAEENIPICYLTYGGWFSAVTAGMSHKNIELRMHQHKKHAEKNARLGIAREIVFGKIRNSIIMLRRNHKSPPEKTLAELDMLGERARRIKKYEALLGIEGMAARIYFAEFNGMIKSESAIFKFTDRNRRPPKDPINAILSFLYSMLVRQAMMVVTTVGMDPYLGFLHMPKYGKPALVLDIIEEFRPIVADSVCITVINNGEITEADVLTTPFGVSLTNNGRRKVIEAYERRMDSLITHPLLGYSASYKRIMETQVRLLSRHILGEIPTYQSFRTR